MSEYAGPPTTTPPEPGWHPDLIETPPPPRRLPAQDHAAIDADERAARRFTLMIGTVAAVTLGVLALTLLLG
ncbi:MAG: hypothetical protein HOV79_08805 [Hamadaea sp.]|nr:hypothetical protein [Hamadaea sp.]